MVTIALIIRVLLSFGFMAALVTGNHQCKTHEIFTCGSLCVETCDYTPDVCAFGCANGCYCKEGFVRHSNETHSPCILKRHCLREKLRRATCSKHEEYLECGSACPATCERFRYPISTEPVTCIDLCVAECFCKKGYYRANNGKCVRRENCCNGRFEKFNKCGSACVETCDYKPDMCTEQCVQGCFCQSPRFVRRDNATGSPCIRRSQCPT